MMEYDPDVDDTQTRIHIWTCNPTQLFIVSMTILILNKSYESLWKLRYVHSIVEKYKVRRCKANPDYVFSLSSYLSLSHTSPTVGRPLLSQLAARSYLIYRWSRLPSLLWRGARVGESLAHLEIQFKQSNLKVFITKRNMIFPGFKCETLNNWIVNLIYKGLSY